ncbi:MAG: hypothetical protein GY800_12850 [Planctomycetes bacterium]|nr:hypothetical protein [Planctomycetota bacterium]
MCSVSYIFVSIFLVFMTAPPAAFPEGWSAIYGGPVNDHATCICQTDDGGYIVVGVTNSFQAGVGDEIWVLKLRPDGTAEWQMTYGGYDQETAHSVHQTDDGGYIVAGLTWSFGAGHHNIWVLKLSGEGTVEWQKTYGGTGYDSAKSIRQTNDGGYILAGECDSFYPYVFDDIWLLKLRRDGTIEWQKAYGGSWLEWAGSVVQTGDGGYVLAGTTDSSSTEDADALVAKLGHDGSIEWQKTYGGESIDFAESILQTDDGGYIVAGSTESFGAGGEDFWLFKLRHDGAVEWQKTYGGTYSDSAHSIQRTADGGYVAAGGTTDLGDDWGDAWVFKLRHDGSIEWQKNCGGDDYDTILSINQTADGGYIAAGYTRSFRPGPPELWVLKLDPNGSIDPSCDIVRDSYMSVKDSVCTVNTSTAAVTDTNASPLDSSAMVRETYAPGKTLCASPATK